MMSKENDQTAEMTPQLVFLATGSSTGLGLHLCRNILTAGHRVIATMRTPAKSADVVAEIEATKNGKVVQLDVTANDLEAQLQQCLKIFGKIDVLVNNAGYGYGGAVEDTNIEEARHLFETLFWGPMRAAKALLPHLRTRGSGAIVNITSTEGVSAAPGIAFYGAAKHALEGASEALSAEVSAFGIRVLIVEPGGMRTEFLSQSDARLVPVDEVYMNSPVDMVLQAVVSTHGCQALDPSRCAKRIVEAVLRNGLGWPEGGKGLLRLPLGQEMMTCAMQKLETLKDNWMSLDEVARSCDFAEGT